MDGTLPWAFVAAAVALFGLPHGALDTRLAVRTFGIDTPLKFALFIAAYVGLALIVLGVWQFTPLAALAGFLAIAAMHFGEDFEAGSFSRLAMRMSAGTSILTLPALFHEDEVAAIFAAIADGSGATLAQAMALAAPLALAAALLATRSWTVRAALLFYAGLAALVPPLIAFAVYFTSLHSPRHFGETATGLGLSIQAALVASAPYAIAAATAGAVAAAVFLSGGQSVDTALAQVIFVGLAALTVPHMLLDALVTFKGRHRPRLRHARKMAYGFIGRS